jgi:hypothetical protein
MEARMEVRRRAHLLGLGDAANHDPWSKATLTVLETMAASLAVAMEDEDVPDEVARRVMSRFIMGSLPSPADAQLRMEMMAERVDLARAGRDFGVAG